DSPALDGRGNLRLVAVDDLFGAGRDGNCLTDVTGLELGVVGINNTNFDDHASTDRALETRRFGGNGIGARKQVGELVDSISTARGFTLTAGGLVLCSNTCACNDGASGVRNYTSQTAGCSLGHRSNS